MQVRFLLGPAGSGKTRQCIDEVQTCLRDVADASDLLFIAPKQATFQIERQVLSRDINGFTRLQILSFERLARHVFDCYRLPAPTLLSEQGRVMVIGSIIRSSEQKLVALKSIAGVHRLAREVSGQIREFQKHGVSPTRLYQIASQVGLEARLGRKLSDLAVIFERYVTWLAENELKDFETLLDAASEVLEKGNRPLFAAIWLDGFAQMTPQEMRLLGAIGGGAKKVTLAFCCESEKEQAWFSHWAGISQLVRKCREIFSGRTSATITTERLKRSNLGRFAQAPDLGHLEAHWDSGAAFPSAPNHLEIIECASTELEAVYAARKILAFVREGGRFREVALLTRSLEGHHEVIRRVFERYAIPMFLDRRQSVSQHPLIELTRSALRVVCDDWQHDDWFALLKSGLVPVSADEIHGLENLALENGWTGEMWQSRLPFPDSESARGEQMRRKLVGPVKRLGKSLAGTTTGSQLAEALKAFWDELGVLEQLEKWQADQVGGPDIHHTVWTQVSEWIQDLRLAFPKQALPLQEWIPLLEHGLSDMTIGVVPPALDQVLVGAVDRSRNPDLQMAICLGLNDGVFPATPQPAGLFSEAERQQLTDQGFSLGGRLREELAQEQFYGYIAFTRPRKHLVVTYSRTDLKGKTAHPSVFIQKLKRLFPTLKTSTFDQGNVDAAFEHECELVPSLLPDSKRSLGLAQHPLFAQQIEALRWCRVQPVSGPLPVGLADRLYGNPLHTSVSKFEDFPACPFKFFIRSGLNAKERKTFELDSKQQGSFQHKLLELFHKELQAAQLRWRDLQPAEARQRIRNIAEKMIPEFGGGIMIAKPENRFLAHIYTGLIEDFIAQIIGWMQQQWLFDPEEVEIGFGKDEELGLWPIELPNGKKVTFHGRIDRIDLWRDTDGTTRYVVIDYKSGGKRLTKALFERGMEQQLSVYMLAIKGSQRARELLKSDQLEPAGGFFVSLRPDFGSGQNRNEVLDENEDEGTESYKHFGLFDFSRIDQLDRIGRRDQIKYRVTKDRKLHGSTAFGAKYAEDFTQTLAKNEQQLREMAGRVFEGEIAIHPFKLGSKVACQRCDFSSVCRFDSWRDDYNVLK